MDFCVSAFQCGSEKRCIKRLNKFQNWLEVNQYFSGAGYAFAEEAAPQLHFVLDVVEAHSGPTWQLGCDGLWPDHTVGVNVFYHCNVDVISSLHHPLHIC